MFLGRCDVEGLVPEFAANGMVVEALDAVERNDTFLVAAVIV